MRAVRTSVPDRERSRGHSSYTVKIVGAVALVSYKSRPECKGAYWGKVVWITSEKSLRNHRLRLSLANDKITLDNPLALYLAYKILCQMVDLKCPEHS